jgi:uncharacterized protein (DUF1800 family)
MERRVALARLAAGGRRLSAPKRPKVAKLGPAAVTLRWTAPKGAKPAVYQVVRNGRVLGRTTRLSFTDTHVKAGSTYRYAVRGVDKHGRRGNISDAVRVKVPKAASKPVGAPSGGATPPIAPVAPGPGPTGAAVVLSTAMVDRLFWRAGFGPSADQRAAWTGRTHEELAEWLLSTTPSQPSGAPPPLTSGNLPIDPLASDDEIVMDWLDDMQRVDNPLQERLAFFWHRHWAVSLEDGIPAAWLLRYRDRMRGFANLSGNPGLSFRAIAYEMTTVDAAMSMYLDGSSNVKGSPNENYAREFMELFCLGPKGPDGGDNYVQADVAGLARAFTGWQLDGNQANPTYGQVLFKPSRFEPGAKPFLGQTIPALGRAATAADGPACAARAVDVVLAHPNHAQFLIRKLWAEFIASPIPQATLDDLIAQYTAAGQLLLRPVLKGILTHPLIFESLEEPNLVKPPVVYAVGVLRALGAPMKGNHLRVALDNMQQRPYRPPNVAGWEGGVSWLNSNTVQARFDMVARAQYLKYSAYYPGQALPDVPVESAQATFDRAYAAAGSPWLSAGTRATLMSYAASAPVNSTNPATNANQRRQRFYTLQALMLGGPDGQVM